MLGKDMQAFVALDFGVLNTFYGSSFSYRPATRDASRL